MKRRSSAASDTKIFSAPEAGGQNQTQPFDAKKLRNQITSISPPKTEREVAVSDIEEIKDQG